MFLLVPAYPGCPKSKAVKWSLLLLLIDLLAELHRKQLAKDKVAGTLSEWFNVKKGVQQGCVLSPYLFNILAEMVMRETLDRFQGGLQTGG